MSGVVAGETVSAVTLRMTTGPVVMAKADIAKHETSERSLMPEGLLESMERAYPRNWYRCSLRQSAGTPW